MTFDRGDLSGATGVRRAHLILYVRDQDASTTFYAHVLGREPTLRVPGMTEFTLATGSVLGLMPRDGIKRLLGEVISDPASASIPRAEVYLLVDDPGAWHARALAMGARELSPLRLRDWGHLAAYSMDADGHVLAFACAH